MWTELIQPLPGLAHKILCRNTFTYALFPFWLIKMLTPGQIWWEEDGWAIVSLDTQMTAYIRASFSITTIADLELPLYYYVSEKSASVLVNHNLFGFICYNSLAFHVYAIFYYTYMLYMSFILWLFRYQSCTYALYHLSFHILTVQVVFSSSPMVSLIIGAFRLHLH